MSLRTSLTSLCLASAVSIVVLFTSCGGSSTHSSSNLTQAQVQAFTTELQQGLASGMGTITPGTCPGGDPNQICVTDTLPCSASGSMSVQGSFTSSLNQSNTGQVTGTIIVVPTNCVSSGSNLVINGDPNITFASTMNILNGQLTGLSARETGAFSYGPNPSGVCESNLTVNATISGTAISCTMSGTMCGQPINMSCNSGS